MDIFKFVILIVFALSLPLANAQERERVMNPVPEPTPIIKDLRTQALTLSPKQIGISPSSVHPHVWGILMEIGYPEALATLVSLADGTTSLYLGHGGGIIGGGDHENVRRATRAFLAVAEAHRESLIPTESFPFPNIGRVTFYVLTFDGTLTADADQNDLGEGKHKLSELFHAGHDVIGELRLINEQRAR